MDTTGAETRASRYEGETPRVEEPVLQIWRSEHVDQYRWVLTFGNYQQVFHGNAKSLDQALSDIEHCRGIHERTVTEAPT